MTNWHSHINYEKENISIERQRDPEFVLAWPAGSLLVAVVLPCIGCLCVCARARARKSKRERTLLVPILEDIVGLFYVDSYSNHVPQILRRPLPARFRKYPFDSARKDVFESKRARGELDDLKK